MQSFAQACSFSIATLQWHTPVPGLGPELCHDRGLAFPRPWDCVGVTVALGVSSVMVSGLACGSGTRAPLWPILPSTDTRVVSVVLRVNVLRSTHNSEDPELPPKAPARGHFTLRLAFKMAFPVDSQGQSSLRTLARAVATGRHYSTLPLVPPI